MDDQQDFICNQCPLESCDENSLWCAFRWATNPNRIQIKMMEGQLERQFAIVSLTKKAISKALRKQYLADYYQDHRPEKLKAANERNRAGR